MGNAMPLAVVELDPGLRVPTGVPPDLLGHPRIGRDLDELGPIDPDARILVVGTGVSAVRTLIELDARGHHGRTLALSRSGRWPRADRAGVAPVRRVEPPAGSANELLDWLGELVREAEAAGEAWQPTVDAIDLPALAARWSERDRAAFRRREREWTSLRHRVPASSLDLIEDLRERLILVDRAAEIRSVRAFVTGLVVQIRLTGADLASRAGAGESWTFEHLVLCTGRGAVR